MTDGGDSQQPSLDLLIHGVWQPIAELLRERFSDMFTVGIPATLSHCYRCLVRFVLRLQSAHLLLNLLHQASVRARFQRHPQVAAFFAAFKLDLYFQLRCKEVFHRVDRGCELTLRGGLTGGRNLFDEFYGSSSNSGATGAPTVTTIAGSSAVVGIDCAALRAELESQLLQVQGTGKDRRAGFQIPLFSAVALELRLCLHPTVLLEPMVSLGLRGRLLRMYLIVLKHNIDNNIHYLTMCTIF